MLMKCLKGNMKKILFFIFYFFLFNNSVLGVIEVDITRGNLDPLPIAISPLHLESGSKDIKQDDKIIKNVGEKISKLIETNLRRSGLFNPLKKDSFVQNPDIAHVKPRFEDWRLIKAQALVTGKVTVTEEKLRTEFRLWDVVAAKEMVALAFSTRPDNWRRVAHIISDKIYKRLTGEEGYFDSRIIYVSETGPKTQRIKKLAIMDQDGANVKYLTLGNELVLTPRFSPKNQLVTYLSYFRNLPRVYLLDIETGVQEVVGDFPGMTFAPRFSPDGKKIIMSFAKDGNSDIYTMNLDKPQILKINTSVKLDENNKLLNKCDLKEPVCIDVNSVSTKSEKKKKKSKNKKQKRCGHKNCNAKLTLTAMECKCGLKFCMKHFSFTKHDCSFDYVKEARENLEKKNVLGGGEYDKVRDRL